MSKAGWYPSRGRSPLPVPLPQLMLDLALPAVERDSNHHI